LLRGALETARAEAVPAQRTTRSDSQESEGRTDAATPLSWQSLAPARPGRQRDPGRQSDQGDQGDLGNRHHAPPRQMSGSS